VRIKKLLFSMFAPLLLVSFVTAQNDFDEFDNFSAGNSLASEEDEDLINIMSSVDSLNIIGAVDTNYIDDANNTIDTAAHPHPAKDDLNALSREELFRRAFGREPPQRQRRFAADLIADGRKMGSAVIYYDSAFTYFNFYSPPFSNHLHSKLTPDAFTAAKKESGDTLHWYNSANLEALGYTLNLSEQIYELHVSIPSTAIALQNRHINASDRVLYGEEVKPAVFSLFTNFYADKSFDYTSYSGPGVPPRFAGEDPSFIRGPSSYNFDGAAAMFGWVFEGSGRVLEPPAWREPDRPYFRRGDMRLVHDVVPQRIRFTVGDVGGISGIMSYQSMGGIRFERNERLFNRNPHQDFGTVEFFMSAPGTVELWMDGRYRRTFHLPAGLHEINGFGGRTGQNSVRLLLRMEDGTEKEIPFEFTLGDSRNLVKGEARQSVTAGVRRNNIAKPMTYTYDHDFPGINAEYMYGFSEKITAGAMGQASQLNAMLGTQMLYSTDNFGWTSLRMMINHADTSHFGGRADISYNVNLLRTSGKATPDFVPGGLRTFGESVLLTLSGHSQTASFNPRLFSGNVTEKAEIGGISGSISCAVLRGNVSTNASALFNRNLDNSREHIPISYRYAVRASQNIYGASMNASAGEDVTGSLRSPFFSMNASYRFGVKRHSLSASGGVNMRSKHIPVSYERGETDDGITYIDTIPGYRDYNWTENANLRWNWSNSISSNHTGRFSSQATLGMRDNDLAAQANARYNANRAELMVYSGYREREYTSYIMESSTLRATLGTSFMFADGLWAVGRPTESGFILVGTRSALGNAKVHIDRSKFADFSRSGLLGAAYHNRKGAYHLKEITVDFTGAAWGSEPQQNRYYTGAAYKQGYALRLGAKEREVIMAAKFINEHGEPLKHTHAAVELENSGAGLIIGRPTFTGANGVLQLNGIVPGQTYRIKFISSESIKDVIITVPKDVEAVFMPPDIQIERE